mgnify:CR=1 FL=1
MINQNEHVIDHINGHLGVRISSLLSHQKRVKRTLGRTINFFFIWGGITMPDYKAIYYHLAGRMATAVEALDATTGALVVITEKLKLAQQTTEDMFMNSGDEDLDDKPEETK